MADVPPAQPDHDDDDDDDETTDFRCYTGVVHVGKVPSDIPSDWIKTTVYFHGFADLPYEIGDYVESSNFYCLGHQWNLALYPGGLVTDNEGEDQEKDTDERNVSLFLCHQGISSIEIEYRFEVRDFSNGKNGAFRHFPGENAYGYTKFIKRETALTYLVKGALVIEKSADIVFEIRGDEQEVVGAKRRRNNDSTPSSKLYAHSLILRKAAPQLAELCKSKQSPQLIEIYNTSSNIFKDMLRYIYGGHIPGFGKDISHTKQIIEVADEYGVINLKLEAEALYVSSLTLTVENVMEHFQFAEAKNCAYLKEKTLEFIVSNNADIMKQKILSSAIGGPSSSDILAVVAMRSRAEDEDNNQLCTMSISELRRKAHWEGVDVDGSREMLISALEQFT